LGAIRRSHAISPIDETPIFYEVFEPPTETTAAPVVLTDGIGCDGYVWKYLRRDLCGARRVLHWHYRGHGRTPLPRDQRRIGMPDLADDLAAILADCGIDSAVLCGHSMGVQVVLETYRRHPDAVSGLILVCGAPENPLRTFRGQGTAELLLPRVRRAVERAARRNNQAARYRWPTCRI
jgi:pimeloyl-ACP methyl ester carboxylesterase